MIGQGASGQAELDQGFSCGTWLGSAPHSSLVGAHKVQGQLLRRASRGGDSSLLRNGCLIRTAVIPTWPWITGAAELVDRVRQHILSLRPALEERRPALEVVSIINIYLC